MNKKLYYLALNVYQYSYVKPIYRKIGGIFIIHKFRTWQHLIRSFLHIKSEKPTRGLLGLQPRTKFQKYYHYPRLSGVMISTVNKRFQRDPEKLKTIFIGHGTGDKPYRKGDFKPFDYYFISGNKHLQKIKETYAPFITEENMIKIGNLRFDEVVNGELDREKIIRTLKKVDPSKPIIVYAPTWIKWGGGTLLKYGPRIVEELYGDYNLIIRPHYYDWRYLPQFYKILKKGNYQNVTVIDPRNIGGLDTMENLFIADLLISDTSSIMYEYLIMQRPIIILDVENQPLTPMPPEMDLRRVMDHWNGKNSLKKLVEDNLTTNRYKSELKTLLDNCFFFNDGKNTQRAVNFINQLMQEAQD